jgi:hypothetical protein
MIIDVDADPTGNFSPTDEWQEFPSTEEQNNRQTRNRNHGRVFTHEKHRELHTGIFGVETDDFRFTFRHVEWEAVGFRKNGSEENQKAEWAQKNEPCAFLQKNNFSWVGCTGQKKNGHDRKSEWNFIADHLRRCTKTTKHWILTVGCPSTKDNAEYTQRRNGNHKQNTDMSMLAITIGTALPSTISRTPYGTAANARMAGNTAIQGAKAKKNWIGVGRNHIFLENKFNPVGQTLKQTHRTNTVWTDTILQERTDFTFCPHHHINKHTKNRPVVIPIRINAPTQSL